MADILIVGGGLIGMLSAIELHRAGASVQILERAQMGGESSWAGGGILSPLYPWRYDDAVNVLAKYGHLHYPQIAQQLHHDSGIDPEYIRSGLMVLDQTETQPASAWAKQWQRKLESRLASTIEPALSSVYGDALYMPEIGQMRNPRLMKSLKAALKVYGIAYQEQAEVEQLKVNHARITGVVAAGKKYSADNVVVAGGAWSSHIVHQYASPPKVEPVKGQMIVFKGRPGLLSSIVLSAGRYLIPRADGRIVVGSTLEFADFDKTISTHAREDLRAAAIDILPALENTPIEKQWAGLRPGSPQGVPYICEHPEVKGLFINAGHFRNGVIIGAASARLIADLVLKRTTEIAPEAYSFSAPH